MSDRPPTGLERLWMQGEAPDREPRIGLSLERIVESAIELADGDGLGAVSMKRVAEGLGFTTMSLYRYVSSKDDLLLLMHNTAWQPPPGLDVPSGGWRISFARWTREQYLIIQRHPWLEQVRHIDRAGTPSQIAWMDLGLRALADAPLSEYHKIELLLLLSGYTFAQARAAATAADGAQRGLFEPGHASEAFGEVLLTIADAERFPALRRSVEGGAFSGDAPFPNFDFGLDVILDGIECLMKRPAEGPEAPSPPGPADPAPRG
jgi:AcrR family transcriptional regulator